MDINRQRHTRERMIHVRLDERTHRRLKILAARTDATVQSVVENLIKRRLDGEQESHDRHSRRLGEK